MRKLLLVAALLGALSLSACSTAEGEMLQSGVPGAPDPARSSEVTPEPMVETDEQRVAVPDVVGMDGWSALLALEDAGFMVGGTWDGESQLPSGSFDVLAQSPSAGAEAPEGAAVVLELGLPALPEYSVEARGESLDVWIDEPITEQQAKWIVWELMQEIRPDGAYFVQINCIAESTDTWYNRQANSRFGVGARGEAISGLSAGKQGFEMVEGATCP